MNKIPISSIFDWLIRIYTFLTIVWAILSFYNLMPYYQIKLYKTNAIIPKINLFPGQQIRLDIDLLDDTFKEEIQEIKWQILKDTRMLYEFKGLAPTIKLPTTEGGIYQLLAQAYITDKKPRKGTLNFYVVQDIAQPIICPKIQVTSINTNEKFLEQIKKNGAEVYIGNDQWKNANNLEKTEEGVTLEVESEINIPSFNNKIFIRAKETGTSHQLMNYDFINVPEQGCTK